MAYISLEEVQKIRNANQKSVPVVDKPKNQGVQSTTVPSNSVQNGNYGERVTAFKNRNKTAPIPQVEAPQPVVPQGNTITLPNGKTLSIDENVNTNATIGMPSETLYTPVKDKSQLTGFERINPLNTYGSYEKYGKEAPISATIGTLLSAPLVGLEGAYNNIAGLIGGDNAKLSKELLDYQTKTREGVKSNIDSNLGDTVYDIGTGMGDMLVDTGIGALTGGGSVVAGALMGGKRADQAQSEAMDRGSSTRRASAFGTGAGIAEGVFNTIGLDKMKEGASLLKAAGIEGAENVLQSAVEDVADTLINGGNSEIGQEYTNLIQNGSSQGDAIMKIAMDVAKQYSVEGATGAGFGMAFKGANALGKKLIPELDKSISKNADDTLNTTDILKQDEQAVTDAITKQNEAVQNIQDLTEQLPEVPNSNVDVMSSNVEPIKVGKATTIKSPYDGETPFQTPKERTRIEIPNEDMSNAVTNIETANIDSRLEGSSTKKILEKVYETLFANKTSFDVPVNGAKFDGSDYNVTVNKNAIGKICSDKNMSPEKLAVIDNLENVINNSEFVGSGKFNDYKNTGKSKNVTRYDYFETDIKINGEDYVVSFDVEVVPGKNNYRTHKVINEINLTRSSGEVGPVPTAQEVSGFIDSSIQQPRDTVNTLPENNIPTTPTGNNAPTQEAYRISEGDGNVRERGYADSIRNKSDMPDEIKQEFVENPEVYKQLSNKSTKEKSDYILANSTTDEAYRKFNGLLNAKDPVAIPLGYDLAKQYIDMGDRETAVGIIRSMSERLTESGQFSQAAAITLMHNDPMTALRYIEKQMDKVNADGVKKFGRKWKDFSLTDEEIDLFSKMEMGDTESIKNAFGQVQKRIAKDYPVTMWEKTVEGMKLGMLLNPRTHFRNAVANALLLPTRSLTDRVSALGQNVSRLFDSSVNVNQSLVGGTKAQKKLAGEIFDTEFKAIMENTGKWENLSNGVRQDKQVFKGNILDKGAYGVGSIVDKMTGGKLSQLLENNGVELSGSVLEDLRKFDYYLLGAVEDDPFVKSNFVNRLASYMKAQGINDIANVPAEAKSIAWEEALKATFKDDNKMTALLSGIKGNLGKFGEILFPFTKTPANLAARAADYSPVGIGKALVDYYKKPLDARDVTKLWDEMSKGIVGTAGIALGYVLAKNGVITGALSSDKDQANFEKNNQGKQAFSLKLNFGDGDRYYTFDWAQPLATSFVIGASINDAIERSNDENMSTLQNIKTGAIEGSKAAVDAWFNASPLQTLKDVLSGDEYGSTSGGIADRLVETVADFPQRLIPSLEGAVARTVDPVMRETYSNGNPFETWLNEGQSKIVGQSSKLPAKYDTWGRERTRSNSTGEAAFAQFINPGSLSRDNKTPIDDEIIRLNEQKDIEGVYPKTAGWTVDGKKLTNEEHSAYQKSMGEKAYELAEAYINSDAYQKATDQQRAETLNHIFNLSDAMAKKELFDYDIEGSNYKNDYKAYKKGADSVIKNLKVNMDSKLRNGESFSGLSKEKSLRELNKQIADGTFTKKEAGKYYLKSNPNDNKAAKVKRALGDGAVIDYLKVSGSKSSIAQLEKMGYSQDKIGKMYSIDATDSKTLQKLQNAYGDVGAYYYGSIKQNADADGNGSLSNAEILDYLKKQDWPSDVKKEIPVLYSKKKK